MQLSVTYSDLAAWERAVAPPAVRVRVSGTPRTPRPYDAALKAAVLPEGAPVAGGPRGSTLEDGSGRSVGGRPRAASKRRAFNLRRVYGPKPYFESMYTP